MDGTKLKLLFDFLGKTATGKLVIIAMCVFPAVLLYLHIYKLNSIDSRVHDIETKIAGATPIYNQINKRLNNLDTKVNLLLCEGGNKFFCLEAKQTVKTSFKNGDKSSQL